MIEPHTGTETAIGTLEVRAYLNGRGAAQRSTSIRLREEERFPTHGPENRYKPAGLREPVAKELERVPTWSWDRVVFDVVKRLPPPKRRRKKAR